MYVLLRSSIIFPTLFHRFRWHFYVDNGEDDSQNLISTLFTRSTPLMSLPPYNKGEYIHVDPEERKFRTPSSLFYSQQTMQQPTAINHQWSSRRSTGRLHFVACFLARLVVQFLFDSLLVLSFNLSLNSLHDLLL